MTDEPEDKEEKSGPLVDVKIDNSLSGLGELKGVFRNALKAITRGVGYAYRPLDRYLDARADRAVANERMQTAIDITKKSIELAKLRNDLLQVGQNPSQIDRAIDHLLDEAVRKQSNREFIAAIAIEELNEDPPADDTSKDIDDDWLTKFWQFAEDVTNDDVRSFYAKILAKEIAQPHSASRLTLNVLASLTPEVARTFERFCRLTIREGKSAFVIHPHVGGFLDYGPLDQYGVGYEDLDELQSFGLLRSSSTRMINYAASLPVEIDYAGRRGTMDFSGLQLHLLQLTRAGSELRELLVLTPVPEYTAVLIAKLGVALTLDD